MKLAQLFPIQNCVIKGCSIVEDVFGTNFVVHDDMGVMLTTAKNVKLFRQALLLLESLRFYDANGIAHVIAQLRGKADVLQQSDYDHSVWRERQLVTIADNNFSVFAGSLK